VSHLRTEMVTVSSITSRTRLAAAKTRSEFHPSAQRKSFHHPVVRQQSRLFAYRNQSLKRSPNPSGLAEMVRVINHGIKSLSSSATVVLGSFPKHRLYKKSAANCKGSAELNGDLARSDVHDQHGVGKRRLSAPLGARSCCHKEFRLQQPLRPDTRQYCFGGFKGYSPGSLDTRAF
jgi:hypothetical protein